MQDNGENDSENDDVISLGARQKLPGRSVLAELEQAWWNLARPDGVPYRRDVNAMMMGPALPYGFILERIAPGHGRMRVAGRKVSDLLGVEARGMPLSALMSAAGRPVLAEQLNAVFDTPALVDLPLEALRRNGFGRVCGRMLLLPLRGDEGEVNRALGAIVFDAAPVKVPVRCMVPEKQTWRIEPFRLARSGLKAIEGAERRPLPRPAETGPRLRLVVNNG